MDALQDLDLALTNTFDGDEDNLLTCSCHNRPAKQTDYNFIPPHWLGRMESQVLDLPGTSSGRRPLRLRLRVDHRPRRLWERVLPTPLGWRETDPQVVPRGGPRGMRPAIRTSTGGTPSIVHLGGRRGILATTRSRPRTRKASSMMVGRDLRPRPLEPNSSGSTTPSPLRSSAAHACRTASPSCRAWWRLCSTF